MLALADLFGYMDHCDYGVIDNMPNWLGVFMSDFLMDVAALGPERANAQPERLKECFDKAMYELRDTLGFCYRITNKLPLALIDQLDTWKVAAPRTDV